MQLALLIITLLGLPDFVLVISDAYHQTLRRAVLYPVVGVILAVVFLQEAVKLKQGLGIVLALLAMMLAAA